LEIIMGTAQTSPSDPDLTQGVPVDRLSDGRMLAGHVGEEVVLLVQRGNDFFAVGATCTHYGGPLADGLVVGDTVRCPWHHACFSLRTGEALHAPAFGPLACWKVERRNDRIFVQHKQELLEPHRTAGATPAGSPAKIVIVGGGAAGFAAAERLRRERYEGDLVMVSGEEAPPVDRPNLSKDYLAGKAPEEWVPLRPASFYSENGIDLRLGTSDKGVALSGGGTLNADLVVAGVGVRPRIALAENAGLALDRGVVVDDYLETSAPGIFAAGDIARWPDPHTGTKIRVEHWVVAERQGQAAALNMLGYRQKFAAVPFFWSQHYDVPINYVGHAETWDTLTVEGDIVAKDCLLRYGRNGRVLAVASIYRDIENLQAELAMEQGALA
jgi:nitrite reductase/ring-hydroxylating ferredoxin subunit